MNPPLNHVSDRLRSEDEKSVSENADNDSEHDADEWLRDTLRATGEVLHHLGPISKKIVRDIRCLSTNATLTHFFLLREHLVNPSTHLGKELHALECVSIHIFTGLHSAL